jgi:hypothetical protein
VRAVSQETIEIGFQTFLSDGGDEFGSVRSISSDGRLLVIYVENAGDFTVPLTAVTAVHSEKVILDKGRLDQRLRDAIAHAHDAEDE